MGFWASAVAVAISSPVQVETNRFAHCGAISSDKKSCEITAFVSRLEPFDMQCGRSFQSQNQWNLFGNMVSPPFKKQNYAQVN